MTDDMHDLETRLRQFRSAGPPSELRTRVLRAAASRRAHAPVFVAAAIGTVAALLVIQAGTTAMYARLSAPAEEVERQFRQRQIADIREAWGATAAAAMAAESALARLEQGDDGAGGAR
jgi:hypothetical protein